MACQRRKQHYFTSDTNSQSVGEAFAVSTKICSIMAFPEVICPALPYKCLGLNHNGCIHSRKPEQVNTKCQGKIRYQQEESYVLFA